MKPAWTEVQWPPSTLLVTLAEARDWVGVYGDESLNAEVQAALNAAVEKVADNVGYRISDTIIVDYFARGHREFELSEPGIDISTVQLQYYDMARALQTVGAANWYLDPTTPVHTVQYTGDRMELGDVKYPIRVQYTSQLSAVKGTPVIGRLKLGVRTALNWYWSLRGPAARNSDSSLLDRTLTSLLMSCRRYPSGLC